MIIGKVIDDLANGVAVLSGKGQPLESDQPSQQHLQAGGGKNMGANPIVFQRIDDHTCIGMVEKDFGLDNLCIQSFFIL
jgi:hypothetical protein